MFVNHQTISLKNLTFFQYQKAKVLFDYEGSSKTELTVSAGDVVVILSRDNEEWWEGELNGKIGFFPKTYCELLDASASGSEPKKGGGDKSKGAVKKAEVLFDYDARSENELTVKQGTTIKILSTSDEEWWQGERDDGETGYFPSNYVKLISDGGSGGSKITRSSSKKSTLKAKKDKTKSKDKSKRKKKKYPQAKVLHDYEGEGDTELSVKSGWVIDVLNKTNDDWWEGRYKGKIGFFPRNYVEIIAEKANSKADEENEQVFPDFILKILFKTKTNKNQKSKIEKQNQKESNILFTNVL